MQKIIMRLTNSIIHSTRSTFSRRISGVLLIILWLMSSANLFLTLEYSLCSKPGVLLVSENASYSTVVGCNETSLTCDSLQSALDYGMNISRYDHSNENVTISICLEGSSTHFIKRRMHFGYVSLQLIGLGPSVVGCSFLSHLESDVMNRKDYTWYFNSSKTVLIDNVHFQLCPYPIRAVAVWNFVISNSSFRNFSEAVLDVFNCQSVVLYQVIAEGNRGTGSFLQSYRGNTGGVAIGFQDYPSSLNSPIVELKHCKFINNSAVATSSFLSSEEALSRQIFTGRGGSLGIFINEHMKNVSINIADTDIVDSYARSYGGGLFIIINGYSTQHVLEFERTTIVSNYGQLAASGVFIGFLSATDTILVPHSVIFTECNFENNTGLSGGGVYIITSFIGSRGNYFRFERCNFTGNKGVGSRDEFGAAIGVALFTIFEQRVTAVRHDVIDCTFSYNSGRNGIFSVGYSPIRFSGTNMFVGNTGAPLRIIGSLVDFEGNVSFINNTVMDEGALSFHSFGQMRMNRGLYMNFEENRGRLGASIVVSSPDTLSSFTSLLYNPQCFALYENSTTVPVNWAEEPSPLSRRPICLPPAPHSLRPERMTFPSSNSTSYQHQADFARNKGTKPSIANFNTRVQTELHIENIQQPLCRENYKKKFHNLICWEEKRHIEILGERCNGNYQLEVLQYKAVPYWLLKKASDCFVGVISGMNTDGIAYATQASEAAFIVFKQPDGSTEFEIKCTIIPDDSSYIDDKLYVKLHPEEGRKLWHILRLPSNHGPVTIEFEVSHKYFDNLVRAVDACRDDVIAKVVSIKESDFQPLKSSPMLVGDRVIDSLIDQDEHHKEALTKIANCQAESPPILINGPFGTGKTRLLALATYYFLQYGKHFNKKTRILLCAHHQASVEHLLERYFGLMKERVGCVLSFKLLRLVNENFKSHGTEYESYCKTFSEALPVLKQESDSLVIVTTTISSLRLNELGKGFFTHIFMDEGAQCREPEAMAALCLATKDTKIIIAGDSYQVGPSLLVLGEEARENGLKYSLLERLKMEYDKLGGRALEYSLTLNINHRCHRDILNIPISLFYGPMWTKVDDIPHPSAQHPLIFVCSSTSNTDELEAQLLLRQAMQYVSETKWPKEWGLYDPKQICIATSTRAQLVKTRKCANREFGCLSSIRMLTTYLIQGQEFQALFWSTAEPLHEDGNTTNPTKSSSDPYVFNTMLTRAKSLVVAVGNPYKLLGVETHMVQEYGKKARCWSSYMKQCLLNETFIIPDCVAATPKLKDSIKDDVREKVGITAVTVPSTQYISIQTQETPTLQGIGVVVIDRKTTNKKVSSTSPRQKKKIPSNKASTKNSVNKKGEGVSTATPTTLLSNSLDLETVSKTRRKSLLAAPSNGHPTSGRPGSVAGPLYTPKKPQLSSDNPKSQQIDTKTQLPPPKLNSSLTATVKKDKKQLQQNTANSASNVPRHSSSEMKTNPVTKSITGQHSHDQASFKVDDHNQFPGLETAGMKLTKKATRQITAQNLRIQPVKAKRRQRHGKPATRDKNYTLSSHSDSFKDYESKLCLEAIDCKLTRENYKEKFYHLLCWEEMEHCRMLEKYNGNYKVVLISCSKEHYWKNDKSQKFIQFGYITCKDGCSEDAERLSYAKQASQGSYLLIDCEIVIHVEHERPPLIKGKYYPKVGDHNSIPIAFTTDQMELMLRWNRKCQGNYTFPECTVQFELKHAYFERLHKAVRGLSQDVLNRIMPNEQDMAHSNSHSCEDITVYPPKYDRLELDKTCQFQALRMILSSDSRCPLLIAGPFGTGKTRLLARAAFELLRDRSNNVLICAHHQASVDTFVDYFGSIKEDANRPWYTKFVRVATRHHRSDVKDKYYKMFRTVGQVNSYGDRYRLVITTLGLAPNIAVSYGSGYFTHILIDEGAQTREPETVGPLCLAGRNTKIVIAGDHYQVGPRLLVFGKEAQSYGLGTSIMERLYSAYDKFPDVCRSLHSELSTNYRCHQGILMLPSHLFYESTLLCRSKAPSHPDAPYPLIFVCTSLDKSTTERRGTDNMEAECLLRFVDKYVSCWPSSWGKEDLESICIMSPSENQWSLIRNKLSKKTWNKLDGVDVLKAYDIQGREYRAIFIGTTEVTDEYGVPINVTKSLCDRFVFNTAITRSQSLVVVVGNPYHLLHGEDKLVVNYESQDTRRCWSHYLQRCFDSKSFHLSDNLKRTPELQREIKALKDLVYQRCQDKPKDLLSDVGELTERRKDAILQAYKSVFQNNPTFKNVHLKLSTAGTNVLSWNIDESNKADKQRYMTTTSANSTNYIEKYECVLKMTKYGKGEAVPLDPRKDVVIIRGFNNRKGAFDGDRVEVGIFDENPEEKNYGKVLRVIERGNDSTFICRVTYKNSNSFSPISGTEPLLINLPFLTRKLLESKDKASVQEHVQSTEDVVVFDSQSVNACLESDDLPMIKIVIPLSVARNMLFVVKFVNWDLDYRNPLGAVIEAFPKGTNLYNAERLLKLQFNINYVEDDSCSTPQAKQADNSVADFYGFTIDPTDAMFLDDAVSLKHLQPTKAGTQVFELGVHIINVAKHVEINSEVDKLALHRGTSVYPGSADSVKAMHMLPPSIREQLSLSPGRCQNVLSCVATVSIRDQKVIDVSQHQLRESVLKSLLKLSYGDAQLVLEGKLDCLNHSPTPDIKAVEQLNNTPLHEAMKTLYTIAFHFRQERLKTDACFVYETSDPGEEHCWQAHMLIEELMIWINSVIASHIHSTYPNSALLRRQRYPNMQQQALVVSNHQIAMGFSHKTSQLLSQSHGHSIPSSSCLLVPACKVKELISVAESKNKALLSNFLSTSRNFPQLAVVDTLFKKNHSSAEYCCTREDADKEEYRHYSLNLITYTHFSSPLRRYIDIVIQRMISGLLHNSNQPPVFLRDKQVKLCQLLNRKSRNAKKFESEISLVNLASELTVGSKIYDAYVCNIERGTIELSFPSLELKNLRSKGRCFQLQHLGPLKRSSSSTFEISMQLTSLSEVLGTFILDSPSFQYIQQKSTNVPETEDSQVEEYPVQLQLLTNAEQKDTLEVTEYSAQLHPVVVVMPPTDWTNCMEFIKNNSDENLAKVKQCFSKLPRSEKTPVDLPKPELCPISYCKFQFNLQPYELFKVWLTWSEKEAFIRPQIQLIELAPFVCVCIQHNTSPALCFSDPALLYASKRTYTNLEQYVALWEKLVLAEAAEKSVKERNLSILHGVKLDWPKLIVPSNCVDEKYYIPDGKVSFTLPKNFTNHCSELFKINVGDLVCVRHGIDPSSTVHTVFHMVVCAIDIEDGDDENDEKIIVRMKIIGTSNCRISETVKQTLKESCELQVIPLSTSYQRVYSGLVKLLPRVKKEDARKDRKVIRRSDLACNVALGAIANNAEGSVNIKEVIQLLKTDHHAFNLWTPPLRMNCGQERAIKSSSNVAFRLIQGPPGTGKSETGAHLAYIFSVLNRSSTGHGNCVLYCGPSNKAVDVVLEKVHKLRKLQTDHEVKIKILRIYGKALETRDFPDPGKKAGRYFEESGSDYTPGHWTREYALHHIIRKENKLIRDKEEEFSKLPKEKIPSGMVLNQYRRAIKNAEQTELEGKYDIIFCTCNEASSQRVQSYVFPRQVIVDESGMAIEPETILPVSLCSHVVLIGDQKQLQPVIDYQPAKQNGLSISLFERYAETFTGYKETLTMQYRMHEEICRFPSKHFYEEKLETDESVKNRTCHETRLKGFWPGPHGPECPILFCDVVGTEGEHNTGNKGRRKIGPGSKFNLDEARKAIEVLSVLHHIHKVDQKELAVLTPYSAQEDKIKDMADRAGLSDVTITTIIKSQGDQYGFVVLSTVRSQPLDEISNADHVQADTSWLHESLGFVTDEHQINVGITRSKYGLIIVGNKVLLEYDLKTWKKLIKHYESKECIISGERFPTKEALDKLPPIVKRVVKN